MKDRKQIKKGRRAPIHDFYLSKDLKGKDLLRGSLEGQGQTKKTGKNMWVRHLKESTVTSLVRNNLHGEGAGGERKTET